MAHHHHRLLHRQEPPPEAPSAAGIIPDKALTVDSDQATATTFVFDPNAPPGAGPTTAPPLVPNHTPVITVSASTPTPDASLLAPAPSTTVEASGSSSRSPIPMSTVIGSCVGAFIGAVAFICLGFWFYRRYTRSLKHSRSRGPLNTRANPHHRRSHQEFWGKLEDANSEDKWDGGFKQPPADLSVPPMEKLTVLKKSPSIHTVYTRPEEPVRFEIPHPFAQNPVASAHKSEPNAPPAGDSAPGPLPMPTPFGNHTDNSSHVLSWDDAAQGSFLTVRTHSDRVSGAMSPTLNMAIPTPPATASAALHHWESAEIVNFDGQSAEVANPFGDDHRSPERRKSTRNPFFGAHEDIPKRRSRSNSIASRARTDSTATSIYIPVPRIDKGKGKAVDPFDDSQTPPPAVPTITTTTIPTEQSLPIPQPAFATHNPTDSKSSVASNERALASLLAALDGEATEAEVQARLRIASMQPSIISISSEGEEDMSKAFPLPPHSSEPSTPTTESYVTATSNRTLRN